MITFAVLGTGPSMSQSVADFVRGKCRAVAVSDAYRLAPWADAVVSHDSAWWDVHPQALQCAGQKFSGKFHARTEQLLSEGVYTAGTNSGLQGMRVAQKLGATRILLLGFDMHGSHFFGAHPASLNNTTAKRFAEHIGQFEKWRGCEVINCTTGSALKRFPFMTLQEALA